MAACRAWPCWERGDECPWRPFLPVLPVPRPCVTRVPLAQRTGISAPAAPGAHLRNLGLPLRGLGFCTLCPVQWGWGSGLQSDTGPGEATAPSAQVHEGPGGRQGLRLMLGGPLSPRFYLYPRPGASPELMSPGVQPADRPSGPALQCRGGAQGTRVPEVTAAWWGPCVRQVRAMPQARQSQRIRKHRLCWGMGLSAAARVLPASPSCFRSGPISAPVHGDASPRPCDRAMALPFQSQSREPSALPPLGGR